MVVKSNVENLARKSPDASVQGTPGQSHAGISIRECCDYQNVDSPPILLREVSMA